MAVLQVTHSLSGAQGRRRRAHAATKAVKTKKPIKKDRLPLSVTVKDGKTSVQQFKGRRFVRFGEFKGKTVASLELFTSKGDSHSLTVYFQDQTALNLLISPGFSVHAEYYKNQGLADPLVLKRWPEIRSEQLP
jgi:hypothetical protein